MILVEAAGTDFETEEDYLDWINNQFHTRGLKAHLQKEGNKYALIYGKHNTKVDYIDDNLRLLGSLGVIEGSLEDWEYILDPVRKDRIILTKYKGESTSIRIPNVLDGFLVSELYDQVFMYKTNITSVEFSEGLRVIGAKAFANCTNLTTIVNWPTTLEEIGEEAFYGCKKLNLNLKFTDTMKKVGANAFNGCSSIVATVTDILISGVEYGAAVFANCPKITGDIGEAMNILFYYGGSTITKIPDNMFYGMTGLTGTITILDNIEEIGEYAFYNCNKIIGLDISGATKIVDKKQQSTLKTIGEGAFGYCSEIVCELDFLEGIKTIGRQAFNECQSITQVSLPSSLEFVGQEAFWRMKKLTTVNLNCGNVFDVRGGGYTYCGTFSYNSALTSVNFGNTCTMTSIPTYFLSCCGSLSSVILPDYITTIGHGSFSNCVNLVEVVYPKSLVKIENMAFRYDKKLITLPLLKNSNGSLKICDNLTEIKVDAFNGCSLLGFNELTEEEMSEIDNDNINYPTAELKEAEKEKRRKTDIINLLGLSHITTLWDNVFNGCQWLSGNIDGDTGLKNSISGAITFQSSSFVGTSIKYGKTYITVAADGAETYASVGKDAFKGATAIFKKYLATNTTEEIYDIEIQEGVTKIGANAFDGCSSITSVTFPSTLTTLGSACFQNCTGLITLINNSTLITSYPTYCFKNCSLLDTNISLKNITRVEAYAFYQCVKMSIDGRSNNITSVGTLAFYGVTGLKSFAFNNGLTTIGNYAFRETGLVSVSFPPTLTSIGDWVFLDCQDLTTVDMTLVDVPTLGSAAFSGCVNLTNVSLPQSLNVLGGNEGLFSGCSSLEKINIPNSVVSIGDSCFNGCSSLKTITGGAHVNTVGNKCFLNCKKLNSISFLPTLSNIGSDAFNACASLTVEILSNLNNQKITIGDRAFASCSNLSGTLTFYNSVVSVSAFPIKNDLVINLITN